MCMREEKRVPIIFTVFCSKPRQKVFLIIKIAFKTNQTKPKGKEKDTNQIIPSLIQYTKWSKLPPENKSSNLVKLYKYTVGLQPY